MQLLNTMQKMRNKIPKIGLFFGLVLFSLGVNAQKETATNSIKVAPKFSTTIKGTVTDATSQKRLSGARVFYKNYTTTFTEENGTFTLSVPNKNVSVLIEMAGYQTIEVAIGGRASIDIALNADDGNPSVYETVTLPSGVTATNRLTGAVGNTNLSDTWSRFSETPDAYLQGKIAGLNATRRSGIANAGANLFLRGFTSLLATNQPLIVVDDVIYDNNLYGSPLANNFIDNPLANIDVRDISNITVLKDASVAALYGTKAANGVILITTSRAKELATKIDFATYGGINIAPVSLPVLGVSDYRLYLSDLFTSGGASSQTVKALPYMNDDKNLGSYYQYHNNTDWQKNLFSNQLTKNIYLKVTGGDNIAKYALSMNYSSGNTALSGSSLEKYSTRFNADMNLSQRLKVATNLSFSYNDATLKDMGVAPKTNPLYLSLVKAPFLSDHDLSSLGVPSPDLSNEDIFKIGNPTVISQVMQAGNKAYRFTGSVVFNYKVSQHIELGTNIGVLFDKVKENRFIPEKGVLSDTINNAIVKNTLESQTKRVFNLSNETYASYRKNINSVHDFYAKVGVRLLNSRVEQDRLTAYNSATDELISVGNGIQALNKITGGLGESNWLNTFASFNYSYSDKYFVSLNASMDASSKFGKSAPSEGIKIGGSPTAFSPAISAAWVLSSENFMANSPFDHLKIRASYGRVGNDDIGNYSIYQYYVTQNLLGMQGLVRGNIANPTLQWETINKTDFGIDLSVLNEKITLSFDAFTNKTSNMLINEKLPTISGFSYVLTNNGAMTTTGLEASINIKALNTNSLKWDVGFTIAKSKAVLDKLPNDNVITNFAGANYISAVGQAPNLFYGFASQGVYASNADADKDGLKNRLSNGNLVPFRGGDIQFVDVNGDKIIDDADKQVIGNPSPDFYGSLTNHLAYKAFTLDVLCTFVSGNSIYNYTRNVVESMSNTNNQSQAILNRWRVDGQVTTIPRVSQGDPLGNSRFSSRWIEDGSYFRVRTISLSYNIPIDRAILKYLTLYATANNVLALTKYLGYDPEFSATTRIFGQGVDNML